MTFFDNVSSKGYLIGGLCVAGAGLWWFLGRGRVGGGSTAARRRLDAVVICGPSGVGKGTLIQRLLKEHPSSFRFSVSHTTRAPRPGEVNGKDYHFVSKDEILHLVSNGAFLESCEVHGNMYGTSKAALAAVRAEGKVALIEMDVQGAQKLRGQQGDLNFFYMFVTAPIDELERRITKRGADSAEKTKIRLETARGEFAFVESNPTFFNYVLINDDLDRSYAEFLRILKKAGASF